MKNPALKKQYTLKMRQDLVDYDYLDKLNEKELAWLNKFTDEYINANFYRKKAPLHKTKKKQKAVYDANNSRNRDTYTRAKAGASLVSLTDYQLYKKDDDSSEDGD